MKRYGFTALAIPGLALAGAIGFFAFGDGPKLEAVPERLVAVEETQETQNRETVLELSTPDPMLGETKEEKDKDKKQESKKLTFTKQEGGYKDGTYTGSAQGYGGTIEVKVVISGGKITSVDIISAAGETPSFLAMAKPITTRIVSAQSPNVDAVSGATYSSNGIINAVIAALNKAGATNLATKNQAVPTKTTPVPSAKKDTTGNKKKNTPTPTKLPKDTIFKNGTYYGSGEGFGGTIQAKVVIKKNKIDTIDIVSAEYETPSYFANAKKILVTMKKKQSPEVDVISGATYSSNGIKDAVREALQKAVKSDSSTKKPKATAKPTVQPTPTKTPKPVPTGGVQEDGSVVTVTTIPYEKVVVGSAVCYPDEYEDFWEYPIDIRFTINGQTIKKTTVKGNKETVEEEDEYSISDISFTEETKALAVSEGNWFFLNRAAEGFGSNTGIFQQLLANNQVVKVDAVTSATCSSDAIWEAFLDAVKKLADN